MNAIRYFLLGFGGIALFVGAFVIFNTLSITVAQRTREFATLRTIGASRKQIMRSVVIEGLVIGLLASVIGLFAGFGLAKLLTAIGGELPEAGMVFALRTILVSLALGTGITLLASIMPALRATRVPPIAAVREGSTLPPSRFAAHSLKTAVVVIAASVAAISVGIFASGLGTTAVLLLLGLGVLALFLGVALAAPHMVKPLTRLVGFPARRSGGIAGDLASANSVRNPSRTASTAAALMIGLTLVTVVAVLGAGLRTTVESAVTDQVTAAYIVDGIDGTAVRGGRGRRARARARRERRLPRPRRQGARRRRGAGRHRRRPGDDRELLQLRVDRGLRCGARPARQRRRARDADVRRRPGRDASATGSPSRAHPATSWPSSCAASTTRPRSSRCSARSRSASRRSTTCSRSPRTGSPSWTPARTPNQALTAAAADFSDANVHTGAAFASDYTEGFSSFLNFLYVLLAFSIVVSLFGMVNTLVLTVFERTRELGMLRTIGMTRRQARRMIRHESIITALIGAALGLPLGIFLAALVTQALSQYDIGFSIPIPELVGFTVVAILAGLGAAILPARRASRLNVLDALHYE